MPRSRVLIPSLLVAVVALSFLPSLWNGFVNWDDDRNIVDNVSYRGLGLEQLRWMWTTFRMGHYQPLAWMTLGLDYVIWGMQPAGYHLTSLLFHAANTVLLYYVIGALLRRRWPDLAAWAAFTGALLYGVHPQRVESVVWATERRDVMCGFFALWTVLAYVKRVDAEEQGRPGTRWLVLSCVAFAASLLSKALSITLPAVLLVLDAVPLGRLNRDTWRRLLVEKVPYVLISCADASVMFFAMRHIEAVREVAGYDLVERAAQAAYGLCFYLVKSVFPVGLRPLYRVDVPLNPWEARFIASMVAVVAGTVVLWRLRRRWPAGLATWVSYGLLLLPVLGLAVTGSQLAADRYTYLAMIPVAVLAAAGVQGLLESASPARKPAMAAVTGALALLSVATVIQSKVWRDSIALWTQQIEHDSVSSLAYSNRGSARLNAGDLKGTIEDCTLAIKYGGKAHHYPFMNRGAARAQLGDLDGALKDFDVMIELQPKVGLGYMKRGFVRFQMGDLNGAIVDLTQALELGGPQAEILYGRANVRAKGRDWKGAAQDFDASLRAAPADWPLRRQTQMLLDRVRREGN